MCSKLFASLFVVTALSTIVASYECPDEYSMCPLKEQIVTPGRNVTLNCMTKNEFQECYWRSPIGHNIHPMRDDKRFIRVDENRRNCNMRVVNVTKRENGNWTCKPIMVKETVSPSTPVNLIVAVPPSQPHLFCYDESNELKRLGEDVETIDGQVGADINCLCTVPSSRPHATITWIIGEEGKAMTTNLTEYIEDVTVTETDISDPNTPDGMAKTTAILKFRPKAEWNGLHLYCQVYHVLLDEKQENEISAPVNIRYLPKVLTKMHNPWKVEIGKGDTKTFAFRSNPAPEDKNVRLAISLQDSISAGQSSRDGHFKLGRVTKTSGALGNDMYEVPVTITDMQKDLTTNRYAIKLSNGMGASPDFFFHVDMEGSGEISDEGLSTALIVVITVVIIAVFAGLGVTYWAKQKNQMCFTRTHKKVPTRPPVKDPEPVTA